MIKKIIFILVTILMPTIAVFAQEFVPLSQDPEQLGIGPGRVSLVDFLNRLFLLSIGVAAVLAVIMIAIGGFKYMMSESAFKISGAKEMIFNAIVGLIIVLTAILILNTINPEIVQMRLFTR